MDGIRRISSGWIVGSRKRWTKSFPPLSDDEMKELCTKLFSDADHEAGQLSKREKIFRQELLHMRDNGISMPFENFENLAWTTSNRLDVNGYGARGAHIQDVGVIKPRRRN